MPLRSSRVTDFRLAFSFQASVGPSIMGPIGPQTRKFIPWGLVRNESIMIVSVSLVLRFAYSIPFSVLLRLLSLTMSGAYGSGRDLWIDV